MPTIPRAEIDAVMQRYGDSWAGRNDLPIEAVRKVAADYRLYADDESYDGQSPDQFRAEADDLDALADRHEREVNA
jgi:hypothetical protein